MRLNRLPLCLLFLIIYRLDYRVLQLHLLSLSLQARPCLQMVSASFKHRFSADYMRVGKRDSMSASPVPDSFSLQKDGDEDEQIKAQTQDGDKDQISAADYDPSLDRREDEARIVMGNGNNHRSEAIDVDVTEEEEVEEEDDDDDMFAIVNPEKKKKIKRVRKLVVRICVLLPPHSLTRLRRISLLLLL